MNTSELFLHINKRALLDMCYDKLNLNPTYFAILVVTVLQTFLHLLSGAGTLV